MPLERSRCEDTSAFRGLGACCCAEEVERAFVMGSAYGAALGEVGDVGRYALVGIFQRCKSCFEMSPEHAGELVGGEIGLAEAVLFVRSVHVG